MIQPEAIAATTFLILFVFSLGYNFHLNSKIKQLKWDLSSLKGRLRENKSQELTEFLGDCRRFGFGFLRVDPGSFFIRSPRE